MLEVIDSTCTWGHFPPYPLYQTSPRIIAVGCTEENGDGPWIKIKPLLKTKNRPNKAVRQYICFRQEVLGNSNDVISSSE